jgi:hypothetical protein
MTPTAPKKQRRVNYLSNRNLLEEIAKSKNSYCAYLDDHHQTYDAIVVVEASESLTDALSALHEADWVKSYCERLHGARIAFKEASPEPLDDAAVELLTEHIRPIVRVQCWDHIPAHDGRTLRARERNREFVKVPFPPFQHFELTDDGWLLVGKSHWQGGLSNGHFSLDHGRMTNELAKMIQLFTDRYARKGSWRGYSYRDEMCSDAVLSLMEVALQFDESRTQNPFAFYTTCITNRFRKVWRDEQKHQAIRDDLLIQAGQAPSMTRQLEEELKQFEPVKLQGKRGRPKSVTPATAAPKRRPGRPVGSKNKPRES